MRSFDEAALPPALPHGPIRELFPDVYFVTGTTRPTFGGASFQFSRNMVIVREGGDLTLINTVRLDAAGLTALEALGHVRHVVRIGAFHGMDDAFYTTRYGAKLWALPGMTHEHGCVPTHLMYKGHALPIADASLFVFETSSLPEGLLLLERSGGILIACDSLQNWAEPDEFFDAASAERMTELGFFRIANVGPGFRTGCEPSAADFGRIKQLSFQHLLSAHGTPLLRDAHRALSATFADLYEV